MAKAPFLILRLTETESTVTYGYGEDQRHVEGTVGFDRESGRVLNKSDEAACADIVAGLVPPKMRAPGAVVTSEDVDSREVSVPVLRAPGARRARRVRDLSGLLLGGRPRPTAVAKVSRGRQRAEPHRGPAQLPGLQRLRGAGCPLDEAPRRQRAPRPWFQARRSAGRPLRVTGRPGVRMAFEPHLALLVAAHLLAPLRRGGPEAPVAGSVTACGSTARSVVEAVDGDNRWPPPRLSSGRPARSRTR